MRSGIKRGKTLRKRKITAALCGGNMSLVVSLIGTPWDFNVNNKILFLEEVGDDGASVRIGDEFVPCTIHREVIEVKGADPVVEEVLDTPHGPIVSPAMGDTEAAIALRAIWLDPQPTRGMMAIHDVESVGDIREVYRHWPGLPLNVVSADASGTIAWQLVGEAPVRRRGWGTLPTAGWDVDAGWADEIL